MRNGVIIINKEKDFTSFDVSHLVKKYLHVKTGHTGTLDPDATGVLPVCLGKGTKAVDDMMTSVKEYQVTFAFGAITDTQDHTGKVCATFSERPTFDAIEAAIKSFVGIYYQIPPMYSAIKVDGKKLYELARQGIEIERSGRNINIYSIEDIHINEAFVSMKVRCGKGTYIRTLCHDIGLKLNNGAYMTSLVRTETGGFTIQESHTLEDVRNAIENNTIDQMIIPIRSMYKHFREIPISNCNAHLLCNGSKIPLEWLDPSYSFDNNERVSVMMEPNIWLGIYQYSGEENILRVSKFYYEKNEQ